LGIIISERINLKGLIHEEREDPKGRIVPSSKELHPLAFAFAKILIDYSPSFFN